MYPSILKGAAPSHGSRDSALASRAREGNCAGDTYGPMATRVATNVRFATLSIDGESRRPPPDPSGSCFGGAIVLN